MTITHEAPTKTITLHDPQRGGSLPVRVWEGTTDAGIPVVALIARIAVPHEADQTQFATELAEQRAPSAEVQAWPLRMVL